MVPQPYRITVVCLGNICRSPMGEAVLRHRVLAAGLSDRVAIDSAGTGDWHIGHRADQRARSTLAAHGYPYDHTARQIDGDWLPRIDLLLAMDRANFDHLAAMIAGSGASPELRLLRSFDPAVAALQPFDPDLDVPDPYYGQPADFADVLRMIEQAADGLVDSLPDRLTR
ncbi:MAG: low molecular weight protein-tyrosine-phosphatase [Candidatus Nanopelagicales bacterium]